MARDDGRSRGGEGGGSPRRQQASGPSRRRVEVKARWPSVSLHQGSFPYARQLLRRQVLAILSPDRSAHGRTAIEAAARASSRGSSLRTTDAGGRAPASLPPFERRPARFLSSMPSITELAPSPSPATTTSAVERAKSAKDAGNDHFKRKAWAEAVGASARAPAPAPLRQGSGCD